jgi:outer membrane protein assembly factor BamB
MKTNKNTKTIVLALSLLSLLITGIFAYTNFADAKNFEGIIPTYAYVTVAPDPVGIGQTVYISMFVDKVTPTATGVGGDRWQNLALTITSPSGKVTNMGPFAADAAGGAPATFVPDELGNYTVVFYFPGQTLTGQTGTGIMGNNPQYIGNVYGNSTSAPAIISVQQDPVGSIPENPLPTEYWQRPVEAFNHQWWTILGNWLGTTTQSSFSSTGGYSYFGNYNSYTQGVFSPHIVWTNPVAPGGQLGGPFAGDAASNYFTGMEYQPKYSPVILNGVIYYQSFPTSNSQPGPWIARDLRTGTQLWTLNTTDSLLCGQVVDIVTNNQYGGLSYLWGRKSGDRWGTSGITGDGWDMFEPSTGQYLMTISPAPTSGTLVVGDDGSLLVYYVNATSRTLNCWNSTLCIENNIPTFFTGATVSGNSWNPPRLGNISYVSGIEVLTPLPTTYGPLSYSITAIDKEKNIAILKAGTAGSTTSNSTWEVLAGVTIGTVGHNGTTQWITNQTGLTPFTSIQFGPAGQGGFMEFTEATMTWAVFNSTTGAKINTCEPYSNALGYYYFPGVGIIAYGNFYTWTYGGQVYCFDLATGNTEWIFNTGSTEQNNPYGVNPFWPFAGGQATVADGIMYLASGHNYGPPLYNGAKIYALNTTTGELVWDFLNYATASSLPVVDGYMTSFNCYDNQIYCYGKGQTATTVATTPYANSNSKILITGTVTDQSPGQTCLGIPAAGTPAISDDSMSAWMAYLYEQNQKPTNATGVPVTLSAIDPNGNYQTIGITTSDANGQFTYTYTPPVPGAYKIVATFGGSNSYFGSYTQTTMGFDEAAATTTPQPTQASNAADLYLLPGIIAIIIAIAVVGAVLLLAIRKRP